MIVIAYDGSDDAKHALEAAAKLFPGNAVTILNVWQRFIDTLARSGAGAGVGAGLGIAVDYDEVDAASEQSARERVAEGTALANSLGLTAQAKTVAVDTTVAEALLSTAAELDASAVVLGTRGLSGVRSLVLGSTAHHVLQHADRPVVVVPSPAVAAKRAAHREHAG